MGTPAHNENTKCLVFNTLTVWLKYQFNDTFEQEISVMLLTIFIETIMHLVYPPHFAWTYEHVIDLSCDDCNTQEKMETMVIYFFWGAGGGEGQGVNKVPCGLGENDQQSLFHVTLLPPCWRHLSQNSKTAAMLVSQTNPIGVEPISCVKSFVCSNKFCIAASHLVKELYNLSLQQ